MAFGDIGGFGDALPFGQAAGKGVVEIEFGGAAVGGLRRACATAKGQRAKAAAARHRFGEGDGGKAGFGGAIRHNRRPRPRS